MNLDRILRPAGIEKLEGPRAKLYDAFIAESHIRTDMLKEGNPNIKKGADKALSLKDSFSKITKNLPEEKEPYKKVYNAIDSLLENPEFKKQLDSLLEIASIRRLRKGTRFGSVKEALEVLPKPDFELLFKQKIIPEKELLELQNFITKNDFKPKEALRHLEKAFLKNFNLEEFRTTFAKLLAEQLKKIK